MELLPHDWEYHLNHFKHQYLQLQVTLLYPARQYLKHYEFQDELYGKIFSPDAVEHHPPDRYKLRVLKELMKRIEDSISDWEEESISDDLMNSFSSLLTTKMPSETDAAQEKSFVTYTLSRLGNNTITIRESRNLLGGTGTTGFRTWEACLQFGDFLTSEHCPQDLAIAGKTILELGAGTGFLSILCAKYLGAYHVTATDGFDDVVDDIPYNFKLNNLEVGPAYRARKLKWGEKRLTASWRFDQTFLEGIKPDIILGADVTYDAAALPDLCTTLNALLLEYPDSQVVIASTVRNEYTYQKFLDLCEHYKFNVEKFEWSPKAPEDQKAPFYRTDMPVRIVRLRAPDDARPPKKQKSDESDA